MAKNSKIIVTENGPYLVSGNISLSEEKIADDEKGDPLKWKKGKEYQCNEPYALCRCGDSNNKPFCDRSHAKGFDGRETASTAKYLGQCGKIEGPGLILTDAESFCSGAKFCHRKEGAWTLTENSDDPESKKLAIEETHNCPSGRLAVWDKKEKIIEPELKESISLTKHSDGTMGPLWIKGKIPVESFSGKKYEARSRMTLCRCGKSKNKPFCDGKHVF